MKHLLLIIIFFIGYFHLSYTQTPISLASAIDTALQNNGLIKNERLRSAYQKALIQTSKNIAPTNIIGEFGQINSYYTDVRVGFGQSLQLPKVYSAQKSLLTEEWQNSVFQVGLEEAILKKEVTQAYYILIYLQHKKKLLQKIDTLFASFVHKTTLRLNSGESNILEKTTAETQRSQITMQITQLEQDMELAQLQFQLLLNSDRVWEPNEPQLTLQLASSDTSWQGHPALQYYQQLQRTAQAQTQVEKSKLLPELNFSYNIMGMKGTGADDKHYDRVPRFQSVQVGLGIPIFTSAQRARIRAAQMNENIAQQTYEVRMKMFENQYKTAWAQYQKFMIMQQYYEETALKNAEIISQTAHVQFQSGDINYIDWFILINQALNIQNEYIEVVKNRNNAAIELNYFYNR